MEYYPTVKKMYLMKYLGTWKNYFQQGDLSLIRRLIPATCSIWYEFWAATLKYKVSKMKERKQEMKGKGVSLWGGGE